jgi:hypothetical protein
MAGTLAIVNNTTAVSTNIDDGTVYKVHSYVIETAAPNITFHVPDEGDTRIIRISDGDRQAQLVISVFGTSRDVLDLAVSDLRLLLREATNHELDDSFPLYYFNTQPSNATYATRHDIRAGWLDDSSSHFEEWKDRNLVAYHTILNMILTPYGYRATVTLQNYLASSSHFLEDSDSDGLADGWTERTAATTVTTIDTTHALVGHSSQKVIATSAASDQGIFSDTVTCAQSSNLSGFAWVYLTAGSDPITVILRDGADGVIDAPTLSTSDTSNTDKSIVSKTGGATWYRVPVNGSNTAAANAYIEVTRVSGAASAGATYYVDATYLNINTQTVPDGWISSRVTENNYSLETEADINYLDVWGLPGDADAVAIWKITAQSQGLGFYLGRMIDGKTLASKQTHWLDSADGTGTASAGGNGVWSTDANASWAGDSAALFTEGTTNNGGYLEFTLSGVDARNFARTPRKIIGLVQADVVAATLLLGVYGDTAQTNFASHNVAVSPAVAANPTLLDLGTVSLAGVLPDNVPDTANPDIVIRITVDGLAQTEKVYIDALFLMPLKPEDIVYHITQGSGFGANDIWIDGLNKQIVPEDRGFDRHMWQGSMWYLAAGQTMNRLVYMTFNNATQFTYDLAAGFNWKLDYIPRGRHLVGSR